MNVQNVAGSLDRIESAARELRRIERLTLETILKRAGITPLDHRQLDALFRGILTRAEWRAGLYGLQKKGFVTMLQKTWGDLLVIVPSNLFPALQQIWLPPLPVDSSQAAESELLSIAEAGPGLSRQLFRLLAQIAKNGLPVTQKGTMHKKAVQLISAGIELTDDALRPLHLKYANADACTDAFAFLFDFALRAGFIGRETNRISIRPEGLAYWFRLSVAELEREWYIRLLEWHPPDEAWLQHVAFAIRHIPKNVWFPASLLTQWADDAGLLDPSLPREEANRRLLEWLSLFHALGWMDLGETRRGPAFRWVIECRPAEELARQDAPNRQVYVQPDLEIIVPPDVSYAVRWELESSADRIKSDQVDIYRLTPESVARAVENGRSADGLIAFYSRHAKYGLPEQAAAAIREWAASSNRLQLQEVSLLRCGSERLAAEIKANPALADYILEAVGNRDFIVQSRPSEAVRRELKRYGLKHISAANRAAGESVGSFPPIPDDSGQRLDPVFPQQGFVYSKSAVHIYEKAAVPASWEELYPGLNSIPIAWLKQWQTYHASTSRQLIETAIRYETYIERRIGQATAAFIPRKLEWTDEGEWRVAGDTPDGRSERITSGQIGPIRLVLPGINEQE